jgi:glycosyl-4,4'-diaponeurosporenoate acyltransferase
VLIKLPIAWVILLNIAGWPVIQILLAWAFTRLPAGWFHPPERQPSLRSQRFYERVLGIKTWKDQLPDAARWFGGGFEKGALADTSPDYLRRFARETWRGELCHWVALAFAPLFFLWNPWWADLIMIAYALAANLPCIFAQRYNRMRLSRLLARDEARRGPAADRALH